MILQIEEAWVVDVAPYPGDPPLASKPANRWRWRDATAEDLMPIEGPERPTPIVNVRGHVGEEAFEELRAALRDSPPTRLTPA